MAKFGILIVALAAVCGLALGNSQAEASGKCGSINPPVFREGFNLVTWQSNGSCPPTASAFIEAAEEQSGLNVIALYKGEGGTWATYIVGAPAAVNASFGEIPATAALFVRLECASLPQDVNFFFEDNVPCKERQDIAVGLHAARNYLRTFGQDVGSFNVRVGGLDFLAPTYAALKNITVEQARQLLEPGGLQAFNTIWLNRDAAGWAETTPELRSEAAAHEFGHLTQRYLGCPCSIGPSWLFEGYAELFAWSALDHAGITSLTKARKSAFGNFQSLESLSTRSEFSKAGGSAYALGFEATDFLSNGSVVTLLKFWEAVGTGNNVPWRQAFRELFGITVEDFYKRFEARPSNPRNPSHAFEMVLESQQPLIGAIAYRPGTKYYANFRVFGVDLSTVALPQYPFHVTPESYGISGIILENKNMVSVMLDESALPNTTYEVTLTLGDGRTTKARFTIPP